MKEARRKKKSENELTHKKESKPKLYDQTYYIDISKNDSRNTSKSLS